MKTQPLSALAALSWSNEDYLKSLTYYLYLSDSVSYTAFSFNLKRCLQKLGISYLEIDQENNSCITKSVICRLGYLIGQKYGKKSELSFFQELQRLNPESTWIWEAILTINLRINNQYILGQEVLPPSTSATDNIWLQNMMNKLKSYRDKFARIEMLIHGARLEGGSLNHAENKAKKLKLAYCLHNSLPESSGGYATRAQGVALGLSKHSIDVTCVTRPGDPWDIPGFDSQAEPELRLTYNNVKYEKIRKPSSRTHKGIQYIEKASEAMKEKIKQLNSECVIAASNHRVGLLSLLAAKSLNLPFIYEVRGFWEVTRISREPEFNYTVDMFAQEFFEALVAINSDHVFTLTLPMKEELISRGIPQSKVTLAPNSCDIEKFISTGGRDERLAAKYHIPDDAVVIGYIGSFVQYEGLENLVEASVLLKEKNLNFRLLLVGNENVSAPGSKGPIMYEIEKIIEEHDLSDLVIMPGRIPHEEVPAHYSLIDIAPFPRKPQPVTEMVSPMKPLESFAMKKAVVVSSVKALVEMVKDRETGLVFRKGSAEDLAVKLEELINNSKLRNYLSKNGYEWVKQNRTWHDTARIMSDKIHHCLHQH